MRSRVGRPLNCAARYSAGGHTRRAIAVLAALVLATSSLSIAGCKRNQVKAAPKDQKAAPPTAPPRPAERSPNSPRIVRATGIIQAVRTYTVRVPQLAQINTGRPQLTVTALVSNGTAVKKGDILVEFDPTAQLDEAREAKAKLEDLEHQLEEKRAKVNSDSSNRLAKIREAEVELGKAELQLRKGPVLADLDRKRNEVKATSAREQLASLRKSHEHWLKAEAATVRVMELKCERQKLVVERVDANIAKMTVQAPHDGMVALESVFRSGSMGPPQVGDQVWPNQPIVRIFDPTEMVVETQVNEPDVAVLGATTRAKVYLDAYPNLILDARLESASPVATAGLESPVKSFSARFRIDQHDPRLLPDLSSSLEIEVAPAVLPEGKTVRSASGPAAPPANVL